MACGAQVVSASVDDARRNAELNGISNATFAVADLEKRMPKAVAERPPPDVVITGMCALSPTLPVSAVRDVLAHFSLRC